MTAEYDPEVLRKLQIAQCLILEDFIKICEENGLQYFLVGGCAIGVERHGGFIPWDDDVDIGMLRKDYEKFREIAKRDYSDKYNILEISEDPSFPFFNMEFNRNGTKNFPEVFKGCDAPMGIGMGIYPFDNVPDSKWKKRRQFFSAFFWHKIKILKEFGHPVLMFDGWKKQVIKVCCVIAHGILKVLPVSHKFINKRFMNAVTKYNNEETEYVADFFITFPSQEYVKKSWLLPPVKKKFEYLDVCVPQNNHEVLKHEFGDYMQLPPEDKRKNHVPYILEFGPYEDLDINEY